MQKQKQGPAKGFHPGCHSTHVRHTFSSSHEESLGRTCRVLAAHGALTELLGSLALLAHRVPTRHQSHHVPILVADGAVALGALRCDAGLLGHVRPRLPICTDLHTNPMQGVIDLLCARMCETKFGKPLIQKVQSTVC
eukprot:Skav234876  [mRNA]  locus=scaffold840:359070:359483:+ [translate_table: standard]